MRKGRSLSEGESEEEEKEKEGYRVVKVHDILQRKSHETQTYIQGI